MCCSVPGCEAVQQSIVASINLEPNYDKKVGMLAVYNQLMLTDYELLAGRVVYREGVKTYDVIASMQ